MNLKVILAGSLAVNAALAVAFFTRGTPTKPVEASASTSPERPAASSPNQETVAVQSVVTNQTIKTIDWRSVESGDYKKFIANLRAIGYEEIYDTVAIVIKLVSYTT